ANEPDRLLRSRTYFYPVAVIFSPFNINYHFEHHANFSVPWYSLPAYHKKAREIVPEALRPYYFHNQYLMQLAGQKPLPPANPPKREEDYEAEDALGGVPVTA
ncbi:MAG: fatty acid desaturase, partial [Deltaproteobacteria bacterium]|nr:fatty acid desaturase [Deltaproteobacteria bacterium]